MIYDWYEIWVDEGLEVPYVLLVLADKGMPGGVIVIDPKQGYQVVHKEADYEKAKLWLLEDEYTQVRGRMPSKPSEGFCTFGDGSFGTGSPN
jgi:hypothetical protein